MGSSKNTKMCALPERERSMYDGPGMNSIIASAALKSGSSRSMAAHVQVPSRRSGRCPIARADASQVRAEVLAHQRPLYPLAPARAERLGQALEQRLEAGLRVVGRWGHSDPLPVRAMSSASSTCLHFTSPLTPRR